jgi:hypothetical protein
MLLLTLTRMRFRKRRLRYDAFCRNHVSWMWRSAMHCSVHRRRFGAHTHLPTHGRTRIFNPALSGTATRILYAGGRQTLIALKPTTAYIDALTGAKMVDVSRPGLVVPLHLQVREYSPRARSWSSHLLANGLS